MSPTSFETAERHGIVQLLWSLGRCLLLPDLSPYLEVMGLLGGNLYIFKSKKMLTYSEGRLSVYYKL